VAHVADAGTRGGVALAVACEVLVGTGVPTLAQDGVTGARRRDGVLAAGVAHATTDLTHSQRFSIMVRRAMRSPSCDGGDDLVVVVATLTNLSAQPFTGRVEHFVLVWRDWRAFLDGSDTIEPVCGLGEPTTSYFGDIEPPIAPHRSRTVRMLFHAPSSATLVRLDYHDDDHPQPFALPRIETRRR
jgi:hypothetical protein